MPFFAPGPVHCPSCEAQVARHPWFQQRRLRDLSCGPCGAQLEVAMPPWSHFLSFFIVVVLAELFALVLLILAFVWGWWAALLGFALFLSIDRARSDWLQRNATIRWINQESMVRRRSGRWVPD